MCTPPLCSAEVLTERMMNPSCGRVLIGFYQVVLAFPLVFDVPLPQEYYDTMRSLDWIQLDWISNPLAPAACLGSYKTRLLLEGLMPLVYISVTLVTTATARTATAGT